LRELVFYAFITYEIAFEVNNSSTSIFAAGIAMVCIGWVLYDLKVLITDASIVRIKHFFQCFYAFITIIMLFSSFSLKTVIAINSMSHAKNAPNNDMNNIALASQNIYANIIVQLVIWRLLLQLTRIINI